MSRRAALFDTAPLLRRGQGHPGPAAGRARRLRARRGHPFYTDSYTDLPLLRRVKEPVIVNPDPRLSREAKKRSWRVERW